jgi:formylglycine-generating enzyme required for sulfatase activity
MNVFRLAVVLMLIGGPSVAVSRGQVDIVPGTKSTKTKPRGTKHSETASPAPVPALRSFEFTTATLDSTGAVTNRRKGQARSFTEDLDGAPLEMVEIPGGAFMMGSPKEEKGSGDDERPQHKVTVAPFYMGKFEVTQAQWRAVAGWPKVDLELKADPSYFKGDSLPAHWVSWEYAVEFCARLSKRTGRPYRLPTEAEWEYACRAGTTTPFAFGETITRELVNYDGGQAAVVGSLGVANEFGLYDMHGNVWEWCQDVWHDDYKGAPTNGSAWLSGGDQSLRVVRGGFWLSSANNSRSAFRSKSVPDSFETSSIGFRVVVAART